MRSFRRRFAQMRPPFFPFSSSGFKHAGIHHDARRIAAARLSLGVEGPANPISAVVRLAIHVVGDAQFAVAPPHIRLAHVLPLPGDLAGMQPGSAGRPPAAEGEGPIIPGGFFLPIGPC